MVAHRGKVITTLSIILLEVSGKRIVLRINSIGKWEPAGGAKIKFICGNGSDKKIIDSKPHPDILNDEIKIKLTPSQR